MVSQGVNPLVETAVAVMEIAEADETGDVVSVETEADVTADVVSVETEAGVTADVVSVETEAGVIIDVIQDVDVIAGVTLVETEVDVTIVEIQDVDVIQGVTAKAEMMTKSVQMNAIEKPVESAPGMRTIEGRNRYDLGDIKARIETIEVKT